MIQGCFQFNETPNMTQRIVPLVSIAALCLWSLGCSASPAPLNDAPGTPPPVEAPKPVEVPKPVEAPKPAKLSPECGSLLEEIRKLENGVPVIFHSLKRPVKEIYDDILKCRDACKKFLAECSGDESCEVRATLVRMELAGLSHYQMDLQNLHPELTAEARAELFREHVQGLLRQAQTAVTQCAPDSKSRLVARRCVVDLLNRLADHEKVPAAVEELLKEFPDYEHRVSIFLQKATSLMSQGRYEAAVEYLSDMIKKHAEDPALVLLHDKLLDALLGVGDLEGVEELVHLMRADYPERMQKIKKDNYLYNQYEQWLCMSLFWLGFTRMAQGDNAGALETFKQHIAEYEDRARSFQEQGKTIGSGDICTITLEYRTRDMIDVIENYYPVTPTRCFLLGDLWATEKRLEWKELRGKVIAAVFRQPGDPRSATFLQEVDKLVKENEKAGLVGITLTHTAGNPSEAANNQLKERIRQDLKSLGVTLPAGADPDHESQKLFREVHATVGTASFVLFGRDGKMTWFLADPRDIDRGVLRRVVERVLAEGKGEKK